MCCHLRNILKSLLHGLHDVFVYFMYYDVAYTTICIGITPINLCLFRITLLAPASCSNIITSDFDINIR